MSDEPQLFVHDQGTRIVVDGMDATFKPGVPRPLRPALRQAAAGVGVYEYKEPAKAGAKGGTKTAAKPAAAKTEE